MQQIVAVLILSCRQVLDITEPSYILKNQYTVCEIWIRLLNKYFVFKGALNMYHVAWSVPCLNRYSWLQFLLVTAVEISEDDAIRPRNTKALQVL